MKADRIGKLFDNQIWLTTKEAAEYLRISENNLRVRVSRGEIPRRKLCGKRTLRFRRDELDKLMEIPYKGNFYD